MPIKLPVDWFRGKRPKAVILDDPLNDPPDDHGLKYQGQISWVGQDQQVYVLHLDLHMGEEDPPASGVYTITGTIPAVISLNGTKGWSSAENLKHDQIKSLKVQLPATGVGTGMRDVESWTTSSEPEMEGIQIKMRVRANKKGILFIDPGLLESSAWGVEWFNSLMGGEEIDIPELGMAAWLNSAKRTKSGNLPPALVVVSDSEAYVVTKNSASYNAQTDSHRVGIVKLRVYPFPRDHVHVEGIAGNEVTDASLPTGQRFVRTLLTKNLEGTGCCPTLKSDRGFKGRGIVLTSEIVDGNGGQVPVATMALTASNSVMLVTKPGLRIPAYCKSVSKGVKGKTIIVTIDGSIHPKPGDPVTLDGADYDATQSYTISSSGTVMDYILTVRGSEEAGQQELIDGLTKLGEMAGRLQANEMATELQTITVGLVSHINKTTKVYENLQSQIVASYKVMQDMAKEMDGLKKTVKDLQDLQDPDLSGDLT